MPKVSIIIPNYNHASFLEKRLNSIFNQTFQDFEVILLDDCSTDNSLEILHRYESNPRVKGLYSNEVNSGNPFAQWRKGIELASGEYIWIAESDDWAESNFLSATVDKLDSTPDTGLIYVQSSVIDEKGNKVGIYNYSKVINSPANNLWENSFTANGNEIISKYLSSVNIIPNASGVLVRRKLLEQINVPDHIRHVGDWYTWIKVLKNSNLVFIARPLNNFRSSTQSTRRFDDFEEKKSRFLEIIRMHRLLYDEKTTSYEVWHKFVKSFLFYMTGLYINGTARNSITHDVLHEMKLSPLQRIEAIMRLFYYRCRHAGQLRSRLKQWLFGLKSCSNDSRAYLVSVVNAFDVYNQVIAENPAVAECIKVTYDNTEENIGIAARYNNFIDQNIVEDTDFWIIFCHQDFGFNEPPGDKLAKLPVGAIYGPVGVKNVKFRCRRPPWRKYYRKMMYGELKQGKNNSDFRVDGIRIDYPVEVDTCDCCCLIVHSSLIRKYNLRFDEKLKFHLYAEDFSITAGKKYDIKTRAVQFDCYHLGKGNYSDEYYRDLEYVKAKHNLEKLYSTGVTE